MNKKGFIFLVSMIILMGVIITYYASLPPLNDKAQSLYRMKCMITLLNILLSILIPYFLLYSGFSRKLEAFSTRKGGKWYFILVIYLTLFIIIYDLLSLPLDFYSSFILQHQYGLSNQSIIRWLSNHSLSLIITIIEGVLILWIPYLLLTKSPARWWLYTSIIALPILAFSFMIEPVVIEPLYYKFQPLQSKQLESRLAELTDKVGISNCNFLQVNMSADTKTMNAYMTGIGNTKRIVLWDNTLNKLSEDEIVFTTAHEMGHYVLGHIWKSMLVTFFFITVMLFAIHIIGNRIISSQYSILGIRSLGSFAAMPLIILIINVSMFITDPLFNAYSRFNEHQADTFALELTRDNKSGVTSFEKLASDSLTVKNPGTLYKIWNYDHPTMAERIAFFESYRPWEERKPLEFEKYFKK
jgi:STE24 endopeptidase